MANDQSLNKEYLPVTGLKDFTEASIRVLLGDDSVAIQEQKVSLVSSSCRTLYWCVNM